METNGAWVLVGVFMLTTAIVTLGAMARGTSSILSCLFQAAAAFAVVFICIMIFAVMVMGLLENGGAFYGQW